jgi:hypothetical protein
MWLGNEDVGIYVVRYHDVVHVYMEWETKWYIWSEGCGITRIAEEGIHRRLCRNRI